MSVPPSPVDRIDSSVHGELQRAPQFPTLPVDGWLALDRPAALNPGFDLVELAFGAQRAEPTNLVPTLGQGPGRSRNRADVCIRSDPHRHRRRILVFSSRCRPKWAAACDFRRRRPWCPLPNGNPLGSDTKANGTHRLMRSGSVEGIGHQAAPLYPGRRPEGQSLAAHSSRCQYQVAILLPPEIALLLHEPPTEPILRSCPPPPRRAR